MDVCYLFSDKRLNLFVLSLASKTELHLNTMFFFILNNYTVLEILKKYKIIVMGFTIDRTVINKLLQKIVSYILEGKNY